MDDWIRINGKIVCSRCGVPIEYGMPYEGKKLKREGDRWIKDEFYDIANGFDQCRCKRTGGTYAFNAEESLKQGKFIFESASPALTEEEWSTFEEEQERKNNDEKKLYLRYREVSEAKEIRKLAFVCVILVIIGILLFS